MRSTTLTAYVLLASVLTAGACVKREVVSGGSSAGVGPSLVVEQFLRAVNARDLARMSQLFGTRDGPVGGRDAREQVEQRMFALASVLQHEDFEILSEQLVPGRTEEATRLIVKLTIQKREHNVPFTMVRYKDANWLVEQIGIDVITAPRN